MSGGAVSIFYYLGRAVSSRVQSSQWDNSCMHQLVIYNFNISFINSSGGAVSIVHCLKEGINITARYICFHSFVLHFVNIEFSPFSCLLSSSM